MKRLKNLIFEIFCNVIFQVIFPWVYFGFDLGESE